MTLSKALFLAEIGFILGIFLGSVSPIDAREVLAFLFVGVFFVSVFGIRKRIVMFSIILFTVPLGLLHEYAFLTKEKRQQEALSSFAGKEVALEGTIAKAPEKRRGNMLLKVKPEGVAGYVLIFTSPQPFHYKDFLRAKGMLNTPPSFEDFDYSAFLAKEEIYGIMQNPEIEIVEKEAYQNISELFYGKLLSLREYMKDVLPYTFSSEGAAILGATLLGDKSMWTRQFEDKLNRTGLTHITAISGQHVAIFIALFVPLLLGAGLWRMQAHLLTLGFVVLFILLTGAEASAVRGGIMGSLILISQLFGRQGQGIRMLALAASVMLLFNPLLLTRDVGFQLSFLAVLGIFLFSPFFMKHLLFLPPHAGIREAGAMTLSAQVFTTPLIFLTFERVSFISPLTNILVAPIVPFLLAFGLLLLLLSWTPLSFLLAFFLHMLLGYFLLILDIFSF